MADMENTIKNESSETDEGISKSKFTTRVHL